MDKCYTDQSATFSILNFNNNMYLRDISACAYYKNVHLDTKPNKNSNLKNLSKYLHWKKQQRTFL